MNQMNKYNPVFILLSCTLMLISLVRCNSSEGNTHKEDAKADLPVVETIPLEKGKLSTSLHIPGELISFQQVDLYARETSFVKKIYADVGTEVKEGQLIVSLEAPEISSRLAGAESRWKSQEAIYLASKANYNRLLETSKTPGTISPNDLDQAFARMNSDKAQLDAAKANHTEVSNTRDYLSIRAPFNGVITARNVNPGAYVGPAGKGSEKPLFTLQEQKKLRLVVSVPEAYTAYLSDNDTVHFAIKARPDKLFTATVKRLAGALDTRLRAERVEMDVANNDKNLLPGMIADVIIDLPAKDSTFIVPKTAVVNSPERVFIITIVQGKAQWVTVRTGRSLNGQIEVYGTMADNAQIAKVASEEIRDGVEVQAKLAEVKK
ncbi:MAG TPA: efflux RND transporter periplasmic adaptor subunit [Cyclobacteriaceae bacterium]|nr:efflux RND transporter periplasmic adaptor subunit [Cyclobacteriaceae bacterium]